MATSLLQTHNVTFKNLLHYPDLTLYTDEITFLSGPSGSGKTTLLKLFNQTLSPDSGSIMYRGRDINEMSSLELRKKMLLISQQVFLFDSSIRENFNLFYYYRGLSIPDDTTINHFLSLCMAPFPLDMNCHSLSGGERQRIYLAIFLSFQPEVLLLDEPTSALDDDTSIKLFENLVSFSKQHHMALIVVTHHQKLAKLFADRIISLQHIKYEIQG
jgi:putative ABC transport system ATP-binding protein